MFAVFPTLLTLGNAACGFGAITFAAKVGPDPAGEHDLFLSAVLIFLAMLFDMLDGSVARWAKQTSEFGAQLDSLCDAVSFGVAPAFLMLRVIHSMESTADASGIALGVHEQPLFTYWSRLLWVIGALFALCACCAWPDSTSRPTRTIRTTISAASPPRPPRRRSPRSRSRSKSSASGPSSRMSRAEALPNG